MRALQFTNSLSTNTLTFEYVCNISQSLSAPYNTPTPLIPPTVFLLAQCNYIPLDYNNTVTIRYSKSSRKLGLFVNTELAGI